MSVILAPCIDNHMKTACVDADRILAVWGWCSDSYLRHGRKLSFPVGTEPSKTYQWRYAKAIASKFDEWNFDDETAKHFIDIAVKYAKETKIIQKGLAVLHQANILDVCYEKLLAEGSLNVQSLASLKLVHEWLLAKASEEDLPTVLLCRAEPDTFCNLTIWTQASRVSPLYLSLSRTCARTLASLNYDFPEERGLLPSQTELYLLRIEFLKDRQNLFGARAIFAQDWRKPCLLS